VKTRWKVLVAFCVLVLGLGAFWKVRETRAIEGFIVDQAVLSVTSFTYEFLARAARDGLWDLMEFSELPLQDQVQAACLSLGLTDHAGQGYCPSITLLKGGDIGVFILLDGVGSLYLSEELVQATGGDMAMLAAVIAHELGHAAYLREGADYQYWSHAKRRIVAQVSGRARLQLLWEEFEPGAAQIRANPQGLIRYTFSVEEEAEAEAYAQELLREAGLPEDGFARFREALREEPQPSRAARFLMVHPRQGP